MSAPFILPIFEAASEIFPLKEAPTIVAIANNGLLPEVERESDEDPIALEVDEEFSITPSCKNLSKLVRLPNFVIQ